MPDVPVSGAHQQHVVTFRMRFRRQCDEDQLVAFPADDQGWAVLAVIGVVLKWNPHPHHFARVGVAVGSWGVRRSNSIGPVIDGGPAAAAPSLSPSLQRALTWSCVCA